MKLPPQKLFAWARDALWHNDTRPSDVRSGARPRWAGAAAIPCGNMGVVGPEPSLASIKDLLVRVLTFDGSTLTEAMLAQVDALRSARGPVTLLELDVSPTLAPLGLPDGRYPQSDVIDVVDDLDQAVGGVLLWITDGRLTALECFWMTDEPPTELPRLDQLRSSRPIR